MTATISPLPRAAHPSSWPSDARLTATGSITGRDAPARDRSWATAGSGPGGPCEADVRRWLSDIRRPDRLVGSELVRILQARGELPATVAGLPAGRGAAEALVRLIGRLRAADQAGRAEQLPWQVLTLSFIQGCKSAQVAEQLGLSTRQLSRERSAAIRLVQAELTQPASPVGQRAYPFMRVPTAVGVDPRARLMTRLSEAVHTGGVVHVHGARGVGKTSLVAEFARTQAAMPVLWYRFRAGVNDTLARLLRELRTYAAGYTDRDRRYAPDTVHTMADMPRLAAEVTEALAGLPLLLVLDDYHVVEGDAGVAGYLDDATSRLDDLRIITISRHTRAPVPTGVAVEVEPLTVTQTRALLASSGMSVTPEVAETICRWTAGLPQLIALAATWLPTATDREMTHGLNAFIELDAAHQFHADAISELSTAAEPDLLEAAAILRHGFNVEMLANVAARNPAAVADTTRRLASAHLVIRSHGGTLTFFHPAIREHLYQRLDPPRRAELHQRAADWYHSHADTTEADHHRQAARD